MSSVDTAKTVPQFGSQAPKTPLGKAILISNQEILRAQHHIELLNKKLVGF
jgi:hypothetical protein